MFITILMMMMMFITIIARDYIRWRLKLEGETENMGVCTKEHSTLSATLLGSYTDHRRHSELNLFRINSE